ncbi:hypothetical protein [Williamsia sp. CHRR-6]|uniref:hypothetical protein n=1 Tax=Williamsia sp. CHRR-6 TaxID=2835871 RepID=UPI001BDACF23|nr:hypothetical protein [Williamsia sp. CHRR-6]MBT0565658.1 hypothetical protein [Williamsia sp. CHRR-6]
MVNGSSVLVVNVLVVNVLVCSEPVGSGPVGSGVVLSRVELSVLMVVPSDVASTHDGLYQPLHRPGDRGREPEGDSRLEIGQQVRAQLRV